MKQLFQRINGTRVCVSTGGQYVSFFLFSFLLSFLGNMYVGVLSITVLSSNYVQDYLELSALREVKYRRENFSLIYSREIN